MTKIVIAEDELRLEFERQHAGRNLKRHPLRGTYYSAPIAALWNQHKRTAEWYAERGIVTITPSKEFLEEVLGVIEWLYRRIDPSYKPVKCVEEIRDILKPPQRILRDAKGEMYAIARASCEKSGQDKEQ